MNMSSSRKNLGGDVERDNRHGSRPVPVRRRMGWRDGGLVINSCGDGFEMAAMGCIFNADPLQPRFELGKNQPFNRVQQVRSAWSKHVVDHVVQVDDRLDGGMINWRLYQEGWDQSAISDETFRAIGAKLAVQGQDLFNFLFLSDEADLERSRIGEVLADASRERELTLKMTSDTFFIPWGMIYTHLDPDEELDRKGRNFTWDGFWGYRHVIEHEIEYQEIDVAITPNGDHKIPMSFNVDSGIDGSLNVTSVADQYKFFTSLKNLACTRRLTKEDLEVAFSSRDFSDGIVYFFCHGIGAGDSSALNLNNAGIALSDGDPVFESDLEKWLFRRPLPTQPMVFINACQGGQLSTIFYDSLAAKFLQKRAKALIGAQIDVPVLFADEYARRFFGAFLTAATPKKVQVGPLMRRLCREFIDAHKNPLGLVYSLYRGMDCFVDWPTPDETATIAGGAE